MQVQFRGNWLALFIRHSQLHALEVHFHESGVRLFLLLGAMFIKS
jgi:hypothetical protein